MFRNKMICLFAVSCLLLVGCGNSKENVDDKQSSEAVVESSTDAADSEYKYGIPKGIARFEFFDSQVEVDDGEPEYQEKTITFITGFTEGCMSNVAINAVNQYLKDKGYDFSVEFVESAREYTEDTGFDGYADAYLRRKKEGKSADIYMALMGLATPKETYKKMAEEGYALCLDEYLETEEGKQILSGIQAFLGEEWDDDKLYDLLDMHRLPDGKLYGLPAYMDQVSPYMLCYNNELKEYYDIPDFQGSTEDFFLVEQYADMLIEDNVLPLCIGTTDDVAFLNLGGYEDYDDIFALEHDEDGKVHAVDFFENKNLLEWYQFFGRMCSKGYLSYNLYYSDKIKSMDVEPPSIPAYAKKYRYVYAIFDAYAQSIGMIRVNSAGGECYKTEYDILDVTTYADYNQMICIDADTSYPRECMEFLSLFYSDMDFRRLFYKGPEGWGYYVDRTEETPVVVMHTRNGGYPFGYGIEGGMREWAPISEGYQDRVDTLHEAYSYMEPAAISWYSQIDFTEVQDKYDACRSIWEKNCYTFWGVYGEDTLEMVEELHQKLIDAGYLDLLEHINRQLS